MSTVPGVSRSPEHLFFPLSGAASRGKRLRRNRRKRSSGALLCAESIKKRPAPDAEASGTEQYADGSVSPAGSIPDHHTFEKSDGITGLSLSYFGRMRPAMRFYHGSVFLQSFQGTHGRYSGKIPEKPALIRTDRFFRGCHTRDSRTVAGNPEIRQLFRSVAFSANGHTITP